MSESSAVTLNSVIWHARLRWIGAPLLLTGLITVGLCTARYLEGYAGYPILFGFMGTGLGLAAFGVNHEATIALAISLKNQGSEPLPESLAKELGEEMARDRENTLSLQAFPKTALLMPMIALAVQAGTAWYALGLS
jgi:hypothetical protein